MQAYSDIKKIIRLILFISIISPCIAPAQNVGIVIDRSLSVDQENRNEATELIIDLLEGNVSNTLSAKWTFLSEQTQEQDPEKQTFREIRQQQISDLLAQKKSTALSGEDFKLLTGHFGDLETISTLSKEPWVNGGSNFGEIIRTKAQAATPTDPTTHLELAKATVSQRLDKEKELFLFVISDGVEDLDNWPISHYLDSSKLSDIKSLTLGDFRDTGKARHLRTLNQKHYKKYSDKNRAKLDTFRSDYSELLLGRLSLRPEELLDFFATKEKKVPVFVYLYHFKPKGSIP